MSSGHAITLQAGALRAELDERGAVITGFTMRGEDGTEIPLMRGNGAYDGDPRQAACFPLLPFCNRIRDNCFTFEGTEYRLLANRSWDRLALHGDGWLTRWDIDRQTPTSVAFAMRREADAASPYGYAATIHVSLAPGSLLVTLGIENTGDRPLPYGLGLHPCFPLTPSTTLRAAASVFFTEAAGFMPGPRAPLPDDLDFSTPRRPPRRWINHGFSGWDTRAEIAWPERGLGLHIEADVNFHDYVVFMPGAAFEPGFAQDYFCFEPMTHRADAHSADDLGGLAVLAPGQALSGSVLFRPYELSESDRDTR